MFPQWKGKIILPTKTAQNEMLKEDVDLYKVQNVLEEGFDCSTSKRAENILERCLETKRRILKVVAVDVGEHYLIIHVGSFKASKKKIRE
jgi:hypothetical protein